MLNESLCVRVVQENLAEEVESCALTKWSTRKVAISKRRAVLLKEVNDGIGEFARKVTDSSHIKKMMFRVWRDGQGDSLSERVVSSPDKFYLSAPECQCHEMTAPPPTKSWTTLVIVSTYYIRDPPFWLLQWWDVSTQGRILSRRSLNSRPGVLK